MPSAAETHCPYCALQCGMTLTLRPAADPGPGPDVVQVEPRGGGLCRKGWTAPDLLDHPDRITAPLVEGRPTSWADALDHVAAKIRKIQREHGRDAVAVFGGGGLTNEKAYALGKFARVALGTKNIDYNGRFCMSSAAAAGNRAFGVDRGLPFPIADLARADTVLLAGANSAETMPPFLRHLNQRRGALIVVDPRATATAREAQLHLQPTPGTDLALANGLLHIAIAEGWIDKPYLAARTTGFDEVAAQVAGYWPARVERLTGVPVADLETAARLLAGAANGASGSAASGSGARGSGASGSGARGDRAPRTVILTGRGSEQHAHGTDTVTAWINLALALGLPGRDGSGYGCLTGQGNGQGGREHGQKADQLPGYRRIDDPEARAHVARVWGVDPDALPGAGPSATELLDQLGRPGGPGGPGGPKALLVFGANPVVSAPNARHVERRLRSLDLLVVADFVPSETAAAAHVVFPTTQWAEEDGTMTNLEGRVLRRRALRPPPPGVRSDLDVLAGLAARLGHPHGFPTQPERVFEELRRASAGGPADYSGISYERLDAGEELHWPCPGDGHPGTPRLFEQRFATADGRARLVPVGQPRPAEEPCRQFPLYLTTGRVLAQYQSGAQTRRIGRLAGAPYVELHPDLAHRLSIVDGQPVRVISARGELTAAARISDSIRPDTVFTPFHWPGAARANSVTSDALDPVSRMPQFKLCAVRVEAVPA